MLSIHNIINIYLAIYFWWFKTAAIWGFFNVYFSSSSQPKRQGPDYILLNNRLTDYKKQILSGSRTLVGLLILLSN